MMKPKILIIEDEAELADILGAYLRLEGYDAVIASDGEDGLRLFYEADPVLILLDIMLPKLDGIEVCKQVRVQSDIPIIMLSAKDGEMDKVIALGVGADDYVTKPYSPLELVARVKAQLRRYAGQVHNDKVNHREHEIHVGRLCLNESSYMASVEGVNLEFTTKEFELLLLLAKSPNQVFSKEQIYQAVWGYSGVCDDNSISVYINRIREKLKRHDLDYIKTIWGAGYKLAVQG
ncbi:two-component response regulator SA14-24 [Lachnospiraceae bacterium KM106-2]|nr:two-component response regulator SA14-24 [Lachnospiraceae bacterium KM106-2]